jgi:hypothetical protein
MEVLLIVVVFSFFEFRLIDEVLLNFDTFLFTPLSFSLVLQLHSSQLRGLY